MKVNDFFKTQYTKIKTRKENRVGPSKKTRIISLCVMVGVFLILFFLRYIPGYAEGYTRTITRFFQVIDGTLFSWIPFSLFEIIVILIVISVILWIVFFILHTVKKGIKNSYIRIVDLGIVISSCLVLYAATVAPNYKRDPIDIPLQSELISDTNEYYIIGKYYQNDFNELANHFQFNEDGSMVRPYSYSEINYLMKEEYKKLDSDYYLSNTFNAKPMYILSWLYSQLQITGVTFPITGEPNFNIDAPTADLPFTIAHEIAHTKGVMREEDANLLAAYICLNSENEYLRYSGYLTSYFSLYSLVQATNIDDLYTDFCKSLSPIIIKNINFINNYWKTHDLFGSISRFFNDIYLMLSQSNTTEAYEDHEDTSSREEGGKIIYQVNSYSPYQALLIKHYIDKK